MRIHVLPAALWLASILPARAANPTEAAAILKAQCLSCHNDSVTLSGLNLARRETAIKGGGRGAAIVPGNPAASLLMRAVRREGPLAMPPTKALSPAEVAAIETWIASGAAWPAAMETPRSTWWSFQKASRPPVPDLSDSWARGPVDRFLLARMKERSLTPAAEAPRPVLIRRLYYSLTGLAPSYDEVRAFEADTRPDAYERLTARLLESRHYGER
ncbi:MAG: DUF1549 domain-containing protein [Acidobacteria bacterium]|nr:DUF1549 domain-containing protein [Acidobacteriota bacterium]